MVLSMFNRDWPKNTKGTLPVTLLVDNSFVDRTHATWLPNGAMIEFGTSVEKVIAIMRGHALAVVAPQVVCGFV